MRIFFLIFCVLMTTPAFAYIDPGTGSFVLQAIAATFFSVTFAIKAYWRKLKNYFIKNKEEEKSNISDKN